MKQITNVRKMEFYCVSPEIVLDKPVQAKYFILFEGYIEENIYRI